MSYNNQPSLLKTVLFTMMRVTSFILTFFFLGGPYYYILDNMLAAAVGRGIPALTTWSGLIYQMFYYGFPTLNVFGVIASIVYMFLVVRRRYYSTDEVYY